jgi:hypothetical protein
MQPTPSPISIRRSDDRGEANLGWLKSRHTFSFGHYSDPAHMGFRSLRVINQDRVDPGAGFPSHPHRDMEIFSYVLEGSLEHKDSMGNGRVLHPGQIQLMSAGTGVTHSEFNPSPTEGLHFLQIWIEPRENGLSPRYTEWHPDPESNRFGKTLLISPDGRDRSAAIQQDACVYEVKLAPGGSITHDLPGNHGLWLQVIAGPVLLNGIQLGDGDGASTETPGSYEIRSGEKAARALLFELC